MIRIHKPTIPPTVLTTEGVTESQRNCEAYEREPHAYQSGSKKFDFNKTVYADESVKQALVKAQHGKCAFCESSIIHVQPGDIEHFRPKRAIVCKRRLTRPGYYWLAYEWDNLLLACEICNRRHKRNHFPLLDEARRARKHNDTVSVEHPVFIHPANEDPETLIGFRRHVPFARQGNTRAQKTIHALGLKRPSLMEQREQLLARLQLMVDVRNKCPDRTTREKIDKHLLDATKPDAPFSAMVRSFLWTVQPQIALNTTL